MYKDQILTISDWYKGQTKHPIMGFGTFRNVDVFENKGLVRLLNRSAIDSSVAATQLPIAEVYDEYGNTYTLTGYTGAGVCYKNGTSIASGLTNAWDMVIYDNYLWVRNSTVMHCYGPLSSGGAQWFSNIATGFNGSHRGALLVGQDDYLYTGNSNYVARIEVTASGTVGVAPTLSTNLTALDLPDSQYVVCLEEYGTKIVIGTQGGATFEARGSSTNARLYAWNRQLGTLGNPGLADLPIIFNENGINAIKQHANKLYVSAGTQGNIYVTDATSYVKIASLPYTPIGAIYSSTVFPNALEVSSRGTLLVGLSGTLSSTVKTGIYEIDINAQNAVTYFMPSSTTDGTLYIGFINNKNYQSLKVGWSNNSSYGVDGTDTRTYDSYGGVIESPLVKVGDYNRKKTFQFIQFDLADPFVSGQNIRVSYRRNANEAYTTLGTWGYSTLGAVISFQDNAPIADCEYLQLKIELDQALATLYGNNINLIAVKLF